MEALQLAADVRAAADLQKQQDEYDLIKTKRDELKAEYDGLVEADDAGTIDSVGLARLEALDVEYFEQNDEYENEKSKLEAATNAATDKAYDRAKAELTKAAAALTHAKATAAVAKTAKEAAEKAVTANLAEVERITKNFNALTDQSGTEATRLRNELSNANSALNRSYTDSRTTLGAYQIEGQVEIDAQAANDAAQAAFDALVATKAAAEKVQRDAERAAAAAEYTNSKDDRDYTALLLQDFKDSFDDYDNAVLDEDQMTELGNLEA